MKSPKPNQNKPTNTHKKMLDWHIQKLLDKPKGSSRCCPIRRGKRQQQKYPISHATNQNEQHHINGSGIIRPAHTKRHEQSHKPTKQKIIGTLSSSHTTHAHPNTPHKTGPVQSSLLNLTHTHTTNQIAVRGSSERNHQRSFSYRHLTKPVTIRPPSGALSVTLTHIKLHTPNQQHKPAGERG